MTAEPQAEKAQQEKRRPGLWSRLRRRTGARLSRLFGRYGFSSITRRILVLNLAGLLAMVLGILYLNQFRAGLIDARVESLLTQGEIIAGAISASTTIDSDAIAIDPDRLLEMQAGESIAPVEESLQALDFPIDPQRVAPILRRLISPTKTRARIYDQDGILLLDSRMLMSRGQILRFDLPPPKAEEPGFFDEMWHHLRMWLRSADMPIYNELGSANGKGYPEVETALAGSPAGIVRVSETGELIVLVAVPVKRFRTVLGALLLSTQGGDIDAIVRAERWAIFRVFLVAATVTMMLSIILAGTIAAPLRRLAAAAERVRRGIKAREEIPDFSDRNDEIGNLSQALRVMTNSLYDRIAAIESFAADVAHELKNPLTSLRSAVETLPLAKSDESRDRLTEIIQHDVRRLDRLISDISDASRLDAELARADAEPVDIAQLLIAVTNVAADLRQDRGAAIELHLEPTPDEKHSQFMVSGNDSRLAQVITNLIDNARSFSPPDGVVRVSARRDRKFIEIAVEDDGPGIRAEQVERIFERFYTDRPEQEGFGNNSGLGLSISRQIVEAHRGTIIASNRTERDPETGEKTVSGARFVVRLPAG
ncbi:MAG: histidine kinase [Hyphomicrobiales bacterium]|nr:MAG: histidine kinase [Hyphomicrobiales bacterium]